MPLEVDLKVYIVEVIGLLKTFNENDWCSAFVDFNNEVNSACGDTQTLKEIATYILRIYGGMGSFSDLVLHNTNGEVAQDEMAKLEQLRSKLFATALSIKTK